MKKIKSTFETPNWYVQEEYDLMYHNLDLPTIYWNIFERLMLFQTQACTEPPYDCVEFSKFMDHEGSIFDYLERRDGFEFINLADNVYEEFSRITDKKITDIEQGVQDLVFLDNFKYDKSILHDKSLNLPGVHPLAYWEINEEVERINYLIDNKPKFLGNKGSKNDKKINNSEFEIVKLARKVEPGYGNEYFHSYDFNVLNEIQELTKNNRNFIHDYLFTINPPDKKKTVDVRIDLTESDNTLIDSFKKLLTSLRKELNIENRKDSILVNKSGGPYIEVSDKIVNYFVKYRVFEFFDLKFWAMLTNKSIDDKTMKNILFKDKEDKNGKCNIKGCPLKDVKDVKVKCHILGCYRDKSKSYFINKAKDKVEECFIFEGDGFKSIKSQARTYLLYRDFPIKNN